MRKTVLLLTGHTGAGKSFFLDLIRREYGEPAVCVSDLGYLLPRVGPLKRRGIEKSMLQRIEASLQNEAFVVADGLASFRVYRRLRRKYRVIVCFLDAPYERRIERIAKRERITLSEAAALEKEIERYKKSSGLERIIRKRDITVRENSAEAYEQIRRLMGPHENRR